VLGIKQKQLNEASRMSTPIVPTLKGQCIAEFLGTALLIFFGTGCVAALKLGGADLGLWEISIIWGIGVSMAVYLAAGVSGAHLNPAVTIALWLFGTFERTGCRPTSWRSWPAPSAPRRLSTGCTAACFSISNRAIR